jgi:hypothetical protein
MRLNAFLSTTGFGPSTAGGLWRHSWKIKMKMVNIRHSSQTGSYLPSLPFKSTIALGTLLILLSSLLFHLFGFASSGRDALEFQLRRSLVDQDSLPSTFDVVGIDSELQEYNSIGSDYMTSHQDDHNIHDDHSNDDAKEFTEQHELEDDQFNHYDDYLMDDMTTHDNINHLDDLLDEHLNDDTSMTHDALENDGHFDADHESGFSHDDELLSELDDDNASINQSNTGVEVSNQQRNNDVSIDELSQNVEDRKEKLRNRSLQAKELAMRELKTAYVPSVKYEHMSQSKVVGSSLFCR